MACRSTVHVHNDEKIEILCSERVRCKECEFLGHCWSEHQLAVSAGTADAGSACLINMRRVKIPF